MKRPTLATMLVVLPLALAAGSAHADPVQASNSDTANAQRLFYEARALMQQMRYGDACPKLAESLRLDPGIGTLFNLSDCNEKTGKIATAYAGFVDVAGQAKALNQTEREKVARKRAQALEGRLPKLVVDVTNAQQGLEVKRDGVVVASGAWGAAVPVDPGMHRITASAPGKVTWETKIQSVEGRTVRVAVPRELATAPEAVALPAPVATAAEGTPAPAPAQTTQTTQATGYFPPPIVEEPGSTQRTLGWVVVAAGAAGVVTGAAFGLSSVAKRNDARSHCVGDQCDPTGVDLRDDAIRKGNVATVSTILGGAALLGGIALVLTAPKGPDSQERTGKIRAVPSFAHSGGGLVLQGAFQ